MTEIKFRQPIFIKSKFNHFHYFGFIMEPNTSKHTFVGPICSDGHSWEDVMRTVQRCVPFMELYKGDYIKESPNGHIGLIEEDDKGNFFVCWDDPNYPDWSWGEMTSDHLNRIKVIGNIYEMPKIVRKK